MVLSQWSEQSISVFFLKTDVNLGTPYHLGEIAILKKRLKPDTTDLL